MSVKRRVTDRLTAAYVTALTLIAILSCGIHVLLDRVIDQQRDTGTVINVAGRQRMLSQRIALLSMDFYRGEAKVRAEILDLATLMLRSHDAITRGNDLGISHPLSPTMHALYFDAPVALDHETRGFIAAVRTLAQSERDGDLARERSFQIVHQSALYTLLPALDQAVGMFESEANGRIDQLQRAQQLVLLILLTTLAAEALFIFRPLVGRVRRYAQQLYDLASRDSLTNLPNRRHFLEIAGREFVVARRTRHAMTALVVDIDHFKRINDDHGHAAGDVALQRFAELAEASLRRSDVIGRTGGEEFTVVLPATDQQAAFFVANKLRQAVEEDRGEGRPAMTISIGLAVLAEADPDLDCFLRRADRALYAAKHAGRNRIAIAEPPADRNGPNFAPDGGLVPRA